MKHVLMSLVLGLSLTGLAACAPPMDEPETEEAASEAEASDTDAETKQPTAKPAQAQAPAPKPAPAPVCGDCGVIASITPVEAKGTGTGAGAAAGAVIGGVVGHQFGGGRGKDLATVAGAIGGALAGNEAEKRIRKTTYYAVGVNMETGGYRTVNVADASALSVGIPVRVVGDDIQLR